MVVVVGDGGGGARTAKEGRKKTKEGQRDKDARRTTIPCIVYVPWCPKPRDRNSRFHPLFLLSVLRVTARKPFLRRARPFRLPLASSSNPALSTNLSLLPLCPRFALPLVARTPPPTTPPCRRTTAIRRHRHPRPVAWIRGRTAARTPYNYRMAGNSNALARF